MVHVPSHLLITTAITPVLTTKIQMAFVTRLRPRDAQILWLVTIIHLSPSMTFHVHTPVVTIQMHVTMSLAQAA